MHILRLRATDFMSWGDLDLDLSDLDFVAIVGKVGAGKSSLIDVITWGLYGQAYHEDVINENADGCSVTVDFRGKGQHVRVNRVKNCSNRGNDLSVVLVDADGGDSNDKRHIKKETQSVIEDYVGLGWGALSAGPLMMQGDEAGFLGLGPSDRKDLLIKVFGVEVYEEYHREAASVATEHRREAEAADAQLEAVDAEIARGPQVDTELAAARFELLTATEEMQSVTAQLTAARERQIAVREQETHAQTLRQTVDMLASRLRQDAEAHEQALRDISKAHQTTDEQEPVFAAPEAVTDEDLDKAKQMAQRYQNAVDERRVIEATLPGLRDTVVRLDRQSEIVKTVPCGGEGIYATCRFLTSAPKAEEVEAARLAVSEKEARLAVLPPDGKAAAVRQQYETLHAAQGAAERQRIQQDAALAQWRMRVENAAHMVATGKERLEKLESQMARDSGLLERARDQLKLVNVDQTEVDALDVQI